MSTYAQNTQVSEGRSREEIERTLDRYGATGFAYAKDQTRAAIEFQMHDRRVRFVLPLPDREAPAFTRTETGRPRSATQARTEYDKAVRQRWRALALMVKAKLEAVESGIVEFEAEFFGHIVLPGGGTVYEAVAPQVQVAYETGRVPPLAIEGPRR